MRKYMFLAPALMLMLGSCSNDTEAVIPESGEVILTAEMEAEVGSRTNFTPTGSFFWTKDDKIKVYGTNGTFSSFKVISGAGTPSATFSGSLSGSTSTCAVYPAEAAKSVSGTVLTFEAPSSYWYDYDQSDFAAEMTPTVNSTNMPMLAKIATVGSTALNFKNLGGAFCFKFKDVPANTSKIVFTANSKICGTFSVDLTEATPTITTSATSNKKYKSISVEFEPSAVKTNRVVYIPVPCGTYEGYEIEMFDESDNTTAYLESSKTKVIERATALRFNEITITTLTGGIEGQDTPSNMVNGHEYVDLGLSVKWATCNIGAEKPGEYGDYFAWGETETKDTYTNNNSKWYGVRNSDLRSQGVINTSGNLTAQYDAATVKWGGLWRMPTWDEIVELMINCSWTWTTQDGYAGYVVTGQNGNSIFMPVTGFRSDSDLHYAETDGNYWCASPDSDSEAANYFYFDSSSYYSSRRSRNLGQSIRPVTE